MPNCEVFRIYGFVLVVMAGFETPLMAYVNVQGPVPVKANEMGTIVEPHDVPEPLTVAVGGVL